MKNEKRKHQRSANRKEWWGIKEKRERTDEDEAFVRFVGTFHTTEELRHEIHRRNILQIRRRRHSLSLTFSLCVVWCGVMSLVSEEIFKRRVDRLYRLLSVTNSFAVLHICLGSWEFGPSNASNSSRRKRRLCSCYQNTVLPPLNFSCFWFVITKCKNNKLVWYWFIIN